MLPKRLLLSAGSETHTGNTVIPQKKATEQNRGWAFWKKPEGATKETTNRTQVIAGTGIKMSTSCLDTK